MTPPPRLPLRLEGVRIELAQRELVPPLDLAIAPGECVTVMGPSGCGKSTLLAMIAGTLDAAFRASGRVRVGELDLTHLPPERRRIGIQFQDDLLFPHLSIAENLAFALPRAVQGRALRRDRVGRALAEADLPGFEDRGIGTSLKLHQRAWALDQGIDRIMWTFDPLVRRNARLNLVKLGGVGVEYLVDFYGAMDDPLNAGDASDRLLVQWDLASARVDAALMGAEPAISAAQVRARGATELLVATDEGPRLQPTSSAVVLVAVPDDIVDTRRIDPALAGRWRLQVRAALEPRVRAGGRVVGLTTDGSYVVEVGP